MFRKRHSSRKPSAQLYANFRQTHPEVGFGTSPSIDVSNNLCESGQYSYNSYDGIGHAKSITPALWQNSSVSTVSDELLKSISPLQLISDQYSSRAVTSPMAKDDNNYQFNQDRFDDARVPLFPWSDFLENGSMDERETIINHEGHQCQDSHEISSIDLDGMQIDHCAGTKEHSDLTSLKRFSGGTRFSHTLEAPSALLKESDEVPTTYLNKGSHYMVNIRDTSSMTPSHDPTTNCTRLYLEFDGDHQRQNAAAYWQFRNTNRGDGAETILPAIQCINHYTSDDLSGNGGSSPALHTNNGLSVIWSADAKGSRSCSIVIQHNFLSTDFTPSQGVKGTALRLCARTEVINPDSANKGVYDDNTEYCRIKLFRNHGAERKTAHDKSSLQRRIEKLEQQLYQVQLNDKRVEREEKEDQCESSPRKKARLMTKGTREEEISRDIARWRLLSQTSHQQTAIDQHGSRQPSFGNARRAVSPNVNPTNLILPSTHSSVSKSDMIAPKTRTSNTSALHSKPGDLDSPSRVLPQLIHLPVACFYVHLPLPPLIIPSFSSPSAFQANLAPLCVAIYLCHRTAAQLLYKLAAICNLDPARVRRMIWCKKKGLEILVDDDVVCNMTEGIEVDIEILWIPDGETHNEEHCDLKLVFRPE